MIRKNILQLLFSGAYLWRWNDKLRPVELSEIEKQAHKMLIACVLWHENSKNFEPSAAAALAGRIIEGALFDYFYRLIITDIKPPVFYKIRQNPDHYRKLTDYVLASLEPVLSPLAGFWERLKYWHLNEAYTENTERRILTAAHLFASQWEFKLIQPLNPFDEEMGNIEISFKDELTRFNDLPGLKNLINQTNALSRFANLCGQLRFQIRWTQTQRIPATSVLGHMFLVAAIAYLYSLSIDACQQRANNNFFSGLFHDFPEVLTRDIISPVKKSFPALQQLIKEYENEELKRRVLKPLENDGFFAFGEKVSWYLGLPISSEFQDSYRDKNKIIKVKNFDELQNFNFDKYDPRDGQLLKTCDLLAAFLEAYNSIINGAAAPALVEGKARLKNELSNFAPKCLKIDALLADFD